MTASSEPTEALTQAATTSSSASPAAAGTGTILLDAWQANAEAAARAVRVTRSLIGWSTFFHSTAKGLIAQHAAEGLARSAIVAEVVAGRMTSPMLPRPVVTSHPS
jgi:hypothetical protein